MRISLIVFVSVFIFVCAPPTGVLADWTAGEDDHKMHYPQLADESGWDVNATFPYFLADD